jgi:hypothetical protein
LSEGVVEMISSLGDSGNQKVFRQAIKEHRGNYYVSYKPADIGYSIAIVQLTFPRPVVDLEIVRQAMEQELENWLEQYPIPTMVTSFDAKDDVLYVSSNQDESHLIGYVNQQTGKVVKHWRFLGNNELPAEQMETTYAARIYEGLPFRRQEDVRLEAYRNARSTGRAIRLIVFLVVGVPVLIEIVSLGIGWIGYALSAISISVGLYKLGKAMEWIKPSKREQMKAEENLKMGHYFYHCERNPDGFNRLKIENFERESIERTIEEEKEILKRSGD